MFNFKLYWKLEFLIYLITYFCGGGTFHTTSPSYINGKKKYIILDTNKQAKNNKTHNTISTLLKKYDLILLIWSHSFSPLCNNARIECLLNQVYNLPSHHIKEVQPDHLAFTFSSSNCTGFKTLSSGKAWWPTCLWEF